MALDPSIILRGLNSQGQGAQQIMQQLQAGQNDLAMQPLKIAAARQQLAQGSQQMDMNSLNMAKQKNDMVLQLLGGVNDQSSYDAAKQQAQGMGLDVSRLPQMYDPSVIRQLGMSALSTKDQIELKMRQQALDQTKFQPMTVTNTDENGQPQQSIYSFDPKNNTLNPLMANAAISGKGAGGAGGASKTWQDAQNLQAAAKAKGIDLDLMTAYSMAKSGAGQGMAYGANGLAPMQGALTAAEQMAQAKKQGMAMGANVASAATNLPNIIDNGNYQIQLLDRMKDHPGLKYATGVYSLAPTIPGTEQADFRALKDQITGGQFLQAYQTLKGAGAITEVEGGKAQNAVARMQASQSEQAFKDAATEYQEIIKRGMERAQSMAQGRPQAATGGIGGAASIPTFSDPGDPAFAALPAGTQFRTSDGQVRVKH